MGSYRDRALTGYLPAALKEVREYQALAHGEQPEIFNLFAEIQIALDNQFIETSTKYGIRRWEKMLGVVPKGTDTLEERKASAALLLLRRLPYTVRVFGQMLAGIFGEGNYELLLDAQACRLKIVMVSWDARLVREAKAMAAGVIPANLEMVAERRMTAALCAKTSIGGAMASAAIYGLK